MSPSQPPVQCRQCGCLNFSAGDLCNECEATQRRDAGSSNGTISGNRRSHVTAEGVLRLANPLIQTQPRPPAPAASSTNRNGAQRAVNSSTSTTPARATGGNQRTTNAQHANGRIMVPPRTGDVTPGRSFGPAIYGGLTNANGPRSNGNNNSNSNRGGPAATRTSTPPPQVTGGSRISPPGSSVEPPSRAAPAASSSVPRNRPVAEVIFGPQLGERTSAARNKRKRVEARPRDVIDLISSDEEETEADIIRREAEELRHEQAKARLALRGVESAEENEDEKEIKDVNDGDAEKESASAPMEVEEEEEEEDEEEPPLGGPLQSRTFDEVMFSADDFPANDVVSSVMRRQRRQPFSPASSVTTNATLDEELMEPDLQPAPRMARRTEPSMPQVTDPPRPPAESRSVAPAPAPAAVTASRSVRPSIPDQPTEAPQPQAPQAPQPAAPDSSPKPPTQAAPQSTPKQPDQATQPPPPQQPQQASPPPAPQPAAQALQPKAQGRQPPDQPPPDQQRSVPTTVLAQPAPLHQVRVQQPVPPEPPARQLKTPLQSAPVKAASVTTKLNVSAQDLPRSSSSDRLVAASDSRAPTEVPAPMCIDIDDSDGDEDEDGADDDGADSSALFQSRRFDSVEFNPTDFRETTLNLGRRTTSSAPVQFVGPVSPPPSIPESTGSAQPDSSGGNSVSAPPAPPAPLRLAVAQPPASANASGATATVPTLPPVAESVPLVQIPVPAPRPAMPPPASREETVPIAAPVVSAVESTRTTSTTSASVNVLQPRRNPAARPAPRPLQQPTRPQLAPSSESPIIKREHAATPKTASVVKPALGYCSPGLLQFMRESMYDDDDEDDDEAARARLLQVVDLTNSTDESGDEEEVEDDDGDYFEIVEQRPASVFVRPALGEVTNSSVVLPGATQAESNIVVAKIKRTRAPRPKEMCVLCEESTWIKVLVHCQKCLKYYHKRCAREYGDEAVCWNCDLDGMIDDSEVTEDHKKEVAGMFQILRNSPESETEGNDEEMKEGEDDDLEEKADAPGDSSPVSLSTLQGQPTRSMKRWKAFLEVGTAPMAQGFEETTNQITTELQDEASKARYSKGFVTKEIVEQAMAEVVDHYAELQDREERAQREERALSPSTTASEAPEIVEPIGAVDVGTADSSASPASTTETISSTAETTGSVEMPPSTTTQTPASTTTQPPSSTTEPAPLNPPAAVPASSTVVG